MQIHVAWQYAFAGLVGLLFALLLIALAEPLGFTIGYVIATMAVMAQASLYTLSVVRSARLASMFACVLGLLFGFLYVVLGLETFSFAGRDSGVVRRLVSGHGDHPAAGLERAWRASAVGNDQGRGMERTLAAFPPR